MRVSTRIIATQAILGITLILLTGGLETVLWMWQAQPDTLGDGLRTVVRPIGLMLIPLSGMAQAFLTVTDPLAWRVVRNLRRKSR